MIRRLQIGTSAFDQRTFRGYVALAAAGHGDTRTFSFLTFVLTDLGLDSGALIKDLSTCKREVTFGIVKELNVPNDAWARLACDGPSGFFGCQPYTLQLAP